MESNATLPPSEAEKTGNEVFRVSRLLQIAHGIRENPHQPIDELLRRLGIGRSQFYKDKAALGQVGFRFEYSKTKGFTIVEDRLTPITGLSLSDRLVLMFALEHLCSTGEGTLAALAMEAGRKLAGGLPSPFKEKLLECFDTQVASGFGARNEILSVLREALIRGQRLRILYTRSGTWEQRWREVDPRHIYMRQRTLYLYARTADENPPQWKVFRVSRIQQIQHTGVSITWRPDEDDGFYERQKNAFNAFLGSDPRSITIRFTGQACHYVREQKWHPSQQIEENSDGSLLFTVNVAEPMEVVRWSRQFGDEASVVSIQGEHDERDDE
ncbi:MAG: WYL domain-containing protein [Desulfovibrionaceae bacterium]|nr:WYL domain-containing protein [Desulfovibrionaceae bacterium]